MTVTNLNNEESEIFEPQVLFLVSVDDDAALASLERDSLEIELNEENTDFEPHSSRNIITSATTTNPMLSFTITRNENSEAFDLLGIRDSAQDGLHVRGSEREKARVEVWYYEDDADPTVDSPQLVDAFENCRTDVSGVTTDTNVATVEVEMHVNGDVYFDATSDLSA